MLKELTGTLKQLEKEVSAAQDTTTPSSSAVSHVKPVVVGVLNINLYSRIATVCLVCRVYIQV